MRRPLRIALIVAASFCFAEAASTEELDTITPSEIRLFVDENAGDVVVVNFWATWCPPCLREFPDIIDVFNDYRDSGLAVLAVSMNVAEDAEDIEEFLAEFAPPFPVLRASSVDADFYERVVDPWYGEMPMTLIYDTSGSLVHTHKKPLTYEELAGDVTALLP